MTDKLQRSFAAHPVRFVATMNLTAAIYLFLLGLLVGGAK